MINYLLYLIFAFTPIFVWLFFYLKKDAHPEPKKMILKVFLGGMFVACIVAIIETIFLRAISKQSIFFTVLESFLLIAFIEEIAKYLVVKKFVFRSPELDEPLDVMLYMVITALGFAAVENIILFFAVDYSYTILSAFQFSLLRFVGAVFLHTLTSATVGFFIAMSFRSTKNKKLFFISGFLIAIILHGFYNFAIVNFFGFWQYSVPAVIIIILAISTTLGFVKLKKFKTIGTIFN